MSARPLYLKVFDFYLSASLHVAMATAALAQMTYYFSRIPSDNTMLLFVFSATVFSYNVIKYAPLILKKGLQTIRLKAIVLLTILAALAAFYCFWKLNVAAQIGIAITGLLCLFYLIPIAKNKSNLRNLAGIKIYVVSLCWAIATLIIPLLNADLAITSDIFYKFSQRFILTLILILIFEINDLKYDDIRLRTVPQSIGILKTKQLIYALLLVFYGLEFFKKGTYELQWLINLILIFVTALFTYYANAQRTKYYTLFWVESMPIFWYLLVLLIGQNINIHRLF